jgi:hypothetical protein
MTVRFFAHAISRVFPDVYSPTLSLSISMTSQQQAGGLFPEMPPRAN